MKKNILITGVSGTGKSTIAEELRKNGHFAVDMDEEFCGMYYKATKEPVMTEFENHDLAWVKTVEWLCDTSKLRKLLGEPGQIFCCGGADNLDDVIPLFDAVLMLHIDEDTFRHRLTHRTNNSWGKEKDVQDWLEEQKESYERTILKHDATCIDANRDIQDVFDDIIKISNA